MLNEYCTYIKREVETISKNQLEVKNDIAETRHNLEEFNSRLEEPED